MPVFKCRSITIEVSFWFFAVVFLFLTLGQASFFLYILFTMLIHEAGHLVLLYLYKGRVTGLRFTAFGIDIAKQTHPGMPYRGEILICIAGAAFNLIAAGLFRMLAFQSVRTMLFIAANVAVAIFNLLPVGNLDGGTLIRLIGERFGGVSFGYKLSMITSLITLAPLFGCAFFLLTRASPNITLLLACFYLAGVVIRMG